MPKHTCTRCGYQWTPRIDRRPVACPQCNARKWDIPRGEEKPMTFEQQARQRVAATPELTAIAATIWYDWPNWDEHMEWIATAPVAEIVDWAEVAERGQ